MRIKLTSVLVDDQDKALKFYTEILGFVKKTDVPVGEFRWLTVVSPEAPDEVELLLEPNAHPEARRYQAALFQAAIPFTMLFAEDVQREYERLSKLGVKFVQKPTRGEAGVWAVFDDTCGNLIRLQQL